MSKRLNRRTVLAGAAVAGFGAASARILGSLPARAESSAPTGLHAEYPSHDPADARAVVAAAHAKYDRVKELIEARPTLAKASVDWGFGDWESALGAASHMGRPDIAELLLAHGARPTIFSAAMLGQLDVVRAFVETSPGIQGTPGPHGFTLLHHARLGKEPAAAVVAYLEQVGGADTRPESIALSSEERAEFLGIYSFGVGDTEQLEVYESREQLLLRRGDRFGRALFALGEDAFFPIGAPPVRIRFTRDSGGSVAGLSVWDPGIVLEAERR